MVQAETKLATDAPTGQDATPLAGLRVIEYSMGFAAGLCGRMLALEGADVTRLTPEGPDQVELCTRDWLDSPKRIAMTVAELDFGSTDVVITDLSPVADRGTFDPWVVNEKYPLAIVTTVTPFGETGPWRGYSADALALDALSGVLIARGNFGRPPVSEPRYVMELAGALNAYNGTLAALIRRQRGTGGGEIVEVSLFESVLCYAEQHWSTYSYAGLVTRRSLAEPPAGMRMVPTTDGYALLMLWDDKHWQTFGALLGDDEFGTYSTGIVRTDPELAKRAREKAQPWFDERTKVDAFREAQELQIPFGFSANVKDLLEDPQLQERQTLKLEMVCNERILMPESPLPLTPAAKYSVPVASVTDSRPLSGLSVVEMSAYWAGPFAGRLLADLGADVVKVEGPSRPDPVRAQFPKNGIPAEAGPWDRGWWNGLNVGKKSLAIDLATREGNALIREVIRQSDFFLDNFSRRVMTNLGLDDASVHEINPSLILLAMSAFGRTGPYQDFIAFGVNLEPTSGVTELVGYHDGPPELIGSIICDPVAGLAGAGAALTAIFEFYWHGRAGHSIDLAQRDALVSAIPWAFAQYQLNGVIPSRDGNRVAGYPIHEIYPCKGEDEHVAISCREPVDVRRLAVVIGMANAHANPAEIEQPLRGWCANRTKSEAFEQLQAAGVIAAPVLTVQDLDENPHLNARGFFRTIRTAAGFETRAMTYGFRFTRQPLELAYSAARFGEHNEDVLRSMGIEEDRISRATSSGVLAKQPTLPFPAM